MKTGEALRWANVGAFIPEDAANPLLPRLIKGPKRRFKVSRLGLGPPNFVTKYVALTYVAS